MGYYPTFAVRINEEGSCYHITLAENVTLRLYAKTNRRIRFEVVHSDLTGKWTELVAKADLKDGEKRVKIKGPHNYSNDPRPVNDLMKAMKTLRKEAAAHLNRLLEQMRAGKSEGPLCRPVVDLLAEISASMPQGLAVDERARLSRVLMYLLCYSRGFRGKLARGELAAPLKALNERGVISWDKHRRFFVLAPEFALAADALENATGNPMPILGDSGTSRLFSLVNGEIVRDRNL